jgi:hypothetical protein
MHGSIPPSPQYVFMLWCSVKGNAGTILPYPGLGMSLTCTDTEILKILIPLEIW